MRIARCAVVTPPAAAAEISDICSFIAARSPAGASVVARRISDAIDSLERLPLRCLVYQNRRDPILTVRRLVLAPYLIYYRVDRPRREVRVLAVRHGARRQPKRFR